MNSECPPGNHCTEAHTCEYDCRQDLDCTGGLVCNTAIGVCEAASGDSGGCGCRVGARLDADSRVVVWLFAGAAFVFWRRRRR